MLRAFVFVVLMFCPLEAYAIKRLVHKTTTLPTKKPVHKPTHVPTKRPVHKTTTLPTKKPVHKPTHVSTKRLYSYICITYIPPSGEYYYEIVQSEGTTCNIKDETYSYHLCMCTPSNSLCQTYFEQLLYAISDPYKGSVSATTKYLQNYYTDNCNEQTENTKVAPYGDTNATTQLLKIVNDYRTENNLNIVATSEILMQVASYHTKNQHVDEPPPGCDPHSWGHTGAAQGHWKPCCYTPNFTNPYCGWLKPYEISRGNYSTYGFEIYTGCGKNCPYILTAQEALTSWKNSPPHKAIILNLGEWKSYYWDAIGASVYLGNAVVWFSNT